MKHWWQQLAARERKIILFGAIILALLFLYRIIWYPLSNNLKKTRQQVNQQQHLLVWMNKAEKHLAQLPQQNTQANDTTSQSLLAVAAQSLRENNLTPELLSGVNQNQVILQFNQVGFDQLIDWLTILWRNHSVQATQVKLTRENTPGVVKASLTLQRS